VSEKVAMRISGHVTRSVFDRYDIGSEDDLIDAAQKLENRRIGHKLGTITKIREQESLSVNR
jgi:hypothetical protein